VQMRESGFNSHYKFVLGAGAKAKTVTNNLPLLSVLVAGLFIAPMFPESLSFDYFYNLGK
jgi:hypothetical protein